MLCHLLQSSNQLIKYKSPLYPTVWPDLAKLYPTVWPDLAKLFHFVKILKILKFLCSWATFCSFKWQNSKNNIAIWSLCYLSLYWTPHFWSSVLPTYLNCLQSNSFTYFMATSNFDVPWHFILSGIACLKTEHLCYLKCFNDSLSRQRLIN